MKDQFKMVRKLFEELAALQKQRSNLKVRKPVLVQAKRALHASDGFFHAMSESTTIGIAVVDKEGRPLWSNRALREITGYGDHELRTIRCSDLTHPFDSVRCQKLLRQLVEGELDSYRSLRRYRRKNGAVVWGYTSVVAIRDANRNFQYAVTMVVDVSEPRWLSPPLPGRAAKDAEVDLYETLTTREREVVHLAAEGLSSTAIARRLGISPRTVEAHRANAKRKLGLRNLADLIRYTLQRGNVATEQGQ